MLSSLFSLGKNKKSKTSVSLSKESENKKTGSSISSFDDHEEEVWMECTDKTLSKLNQLLSNKDLADAVLVVDSGKKYPIVRALIANWSSVLKDQLYGSDFTPGFEVKVETNETAMDLFLSVVHRGDTANHSIDNFVDLYAFANRYGVKDLEELTLQTMKETDIDAEHCFLLLDKCEKYVNKYTEISGLKNTLLTKIAAEFDDFSEAKQFVLLSIDDIRLLVRGKQLICSEGSLLKAIMKWVEHSKETRMQYLDELLAEIRFPLVDEEILSTIDAHPLLEHKRQELFPIIYDAMKFKLNPDASHIVRDYRYQERECILESYIPKGFDIKFTTLGQKGRTGPLTIGNHYDHCKFLKDKVKLVGGKQEWVIPITGYYRIIAAGARGGKNTYSGSQREGYGARVSGTFHLRRGTLLTILVGQCGDDCLNGSSCGAGGGGGGTFVAVNGEPLIVAAGGSGANWYSWKVAGPGGRGCHPELYSARKDTSAKGDRGGGGGGFYKDGSNGDQCVGGKSFLNGGEGGTFSNSCGANGGFGGGGGSLYEGGGGGGYCGGICVLQNDYSNRHEDDGALSFNSGVDQEEYPDDNDSDGYVKINRVLFAHIKDKKALRNVSTPASE
ncbi:hypothetical protein FDP41_001968 [Naegleria fowleri]|uniref:receptor protein-tyrosine kinase n=1 Tax=Naegleria fowleri TaxID=5763 RepID=A0A6A5BYX3_NAEFO|nr:uncharacterized protein FDP41_001968 [Naegleria fowleri]KAF0978898.1 hypothetical protein FDP41_001968 [Naegleria fowleri]